MALGHLDALAVDADVVGRRVGLRAELADGDAVHRDAALASSAVSAARRDATPACERIFCSRSTTNS